MTTSRTVARKLYLLQVSTTAVPLASGQALEMSSGCYLVEKNDGRHILTVFGHDGSQWKSLKKSPEFYP